jgi:hypothetical protein
MSDIRFHSLAQLRRFAVALALLAAPALADAANIPVGFHGTWVRTDTACGSGASLTIEANRVTFRNGKHTQSYTKLEIVRSGKAARGALEVLADLPDGSPFLLFLTPGSPPAVNLNWRPLDEPYAKRYPLAPEALKRCRG